MNHLVDVLLPTFNNPQQLFSTIHSFRRTVPRGLARLIVLNNGHAKSLPSSFQDPTEGEIIQCGTNLGWEGALKVGWRRSSAPFVMFLNDDVFFPGNDVGWLQRLLAVHTDPVVAASGPSSNVVMGQQNMFWGDQQLKRKDVSLLIGFCVLYKRAVLDQVGGIDASLPGGDDFDISIRLRDAGYKLICLMDTFVFHHGFQTGQRTHGSYWNSQLMQERTNNALIRKHGMKKFYECTSQAYRPYTILANGKTWEGESDAEGHLCRQYIQGDAVLDLGCGCSKTVPHAVGVDCIPAGERNSTLAESSVADLIGDVQYTLPVEDGSQDTIIARHILEHLIDPLAALQHWTRALKIGGRLLLATPDPSYGNSILMNPEHVHAFTLLSLRTLTEACGLKEVATHDRFNGVSFLVVYEKQPVNGHRLGVAWQETHEVVA